MIKGYKVGYVSFTCIIVSLWFQGFKVQRILLLVSIEILQSSNSRRFITFWHLVCAQNKLQHKMPSLKPPNFIHKLWFFGYMFLLNVQFDFRFDFTSMGLPNVASFSRSTSSFGLSILLSIIYIFGSSNQSVIGNTHGLHGSIEAIDAWTIGEFQVLLSLAPWVLEVLLAPWVLEVLLAPLVCLMF